MIENYYQTLNKAETDNDIHRIVCELLDIEYVEWTSDRRSNRKWSVKRQTKKVE